MAKSPIWRGTKIAASYLKRLQLGAGSWNEWRRVHQNIKLDFSSAKLNQRKYEFITTALSYAIPPANLRGADLSNADLHEANLSKVDISGAYLKGANLSGAHLDEANLSNTDLSGANQSEAG